MAPSVSFVSLLLFTFLAINNQASARDLPQGGITFVQEPDESYYIAKKLPAEITCRARNAADIIFRCAGTQIPPSSIEVPETNLDTPEETQATIKVTWADVENFVKTGKLFQCECAALDVDGQEVITSRQATVSLAYISNKFEGHPENVAALEGDMAELVCVPPEGEPKPEVVWRKDTRRIELVRHPRLQLSEGGSLIIKSVTPSDAGTYQCVARNVIGRRESKQAVLSVLALAEASQTAMEFNQVDEASQGDVSKARNTRQSGVAYFTLEPNEVYYVEKDKNVTIDCGAVAADLLTFRCNGRRMEREKVTTTTGMSTDGVKIIQAKISLGYNEIESALLQNPLISYQCVCVAWHMKQEDPKKDNAWAQVASNKQNGLILLAALEKVFKLEPVDTTAGLNTDAVLKCEPPNGQPKPWVIWYKDRVRVDPRNSTKYSVNARGHLTIRRVQYADAGTYSCQADNGVATAQSRSGRLTVIADAPRSTTPATTTSASEVEDEYVPVFPEEVLSSPTILHDFKSESFLGPDGTSKLTCAAIAAHQVTIDCLGSRLSANDVTIKYERDTKSDKLISVASTVITAAKLPTSEEFFCECVAWYNNNSNWQSVRGQKGYVRAGKATVKPDYLEKKFEKSPRGRAIELDEDFLLECRPPAGMPKPTVYWLKDGKRIDPMEDSNYVLMPEGDLVIESVRAIDEGIYICVAENTAGTRRSAEARLRFRERPTALPRTTKTTPATTPPQLPDSTTEVDLSKIEEPFFTEEPQEENYLIDADIIQIKCTVYGAFNLVFACNGQVVRASTTTSNSISLDEVSQPLRENTLTVTRAQIESFPGKYTCTCRGMYKKQGTNEVTYVESKEALLAVAFLDDTFNQEPEDTDVTIRSTVTLPCIPPNAFPAPEIVWEKDGQIVNASQRVVIRESGSLVIQSFDEADQGNYKCLARNIVGEKASSEVTISLKGADEVFVTETKSEVDATMVPKPEPTGSVTYYGVPYISKDLHSTYYLVKSKTKPVMISCEAVNVHTITFQCNNQPVDTEIRKREVASSEYSNLVTVVEGTIVVSKNELEDIESFECQCFAHFSGSEGEAQTLTSIKSRVEFAGLKKNFQAEPEDKTVEAGTLLTIQCKPPQGNPTPTVRWTKDGKNIEASYDALIGNLIIHEAKLENTGEYVCIAENVAGSRSSRPALIEVKAASTDSELGTTTSFMVKESTAQPDVIEGGEGEKVDHGDGDYVTQEVIKVEKEDGKSEQTNCIAKLATCTGILARENNEFAKCSAQPQYDECMSGFIKACSEQVSPEALEGATMTQKQLQMACSTKQCASLESCTVISSNLPDNSVVPKRLPIKEVCEDVPQFFTCVHGGLNECNVTLVPQEDADQGSQMVVDWITQYCTRLVLGSSSVATCDEMTQCDLEITTLSRDNVTYWCRLMHTLVDCTAKAVRMCELDELTQDLEWLSAQKKACSAVTIEPKVEPQPSGEPHPDGKSDNGSKPDGDDDDDSEEKTTEAGDNNEGVEKEEIGDPEDPKAATGDNNTSFKTSASFLAIFLQLILVAILSRR